MSQPPMDDDFQDRIQRILNDKKKDDLRKQFGMSFEGHNEEMSPQMESEWLEYLTEFEKQLENAKRLTVRERIGNPDVMSLAEISDDDLPVELDRILELLSENHIAIDFLHDRDEREMYRFITEELLDEETDDIRNPGMVSHFIYEEFHPNDEDDISQSIDEFLYALFREYPYSSFRGVCTAAGKSPRLAYRDGRLRRNSERNPLDSCFAGVLLPILM